MNRALVYPLCEPPLLMLYLVITDPEGEPSIPHPLSVRPVLAVPRQWNNSFHSTRQGILHRRNPRLITLRSSLHHRRNPRLIRFRSSLHATVGSDDGYTSTPIFIPQGILKLPCTKFS